MSVCARVFLNREKGKGLRFRTAWIDEDTQKAIKSLGLENTIPDEYVDISFDGKYAKYKVGVHDVFIKVESV